MKANAASAARFRQRGPSTKPPTRLLSTKQSIRHLTSRRSIFSADYFASRRAALANGFLFWLAYRRRCARKVRRTATRSFPPRRPLRIGYILHDTPNVLHPPALVT